MNARKKLNQKRTRRAARSSARIFGTSDRPRLAVHRTNRFIYAELIDDTKGFTLAAASNVGVKGEENEGRCRGNGGGGDWKESDRSGDHESGV